MQSNSAIAASIKRAVTYISQTLENGESPALENIAAASGLSKFHFHRLYSLLTGETCQQTITRLRLARGTDALRDGSVSITEAAFQAGFGSSQAFAKAMKREIKKTASELRADPECLAATLEILSMPKQSGNEPPIKVELVSLDPFEIIVMPTYGDYPHLNDTYRALFEFAGGPENVTAILGQPHGDILMAGEKDMVFECGLCVKLDIESLPADYVRKLIPRGQYLRRRHIGGDDHLPQTLDGIYRFIVQHGGVVIADVPPLFHYIDDPEEVAEELWRTDIYIKIEGDL